MFSFLSRMRLPGYTSTNEDDTNLPFPATSKHQERLGHKKGESMSSSGTSKDGKLSQLNTLAISAPIPRSSPSSITGFDNDNLVAGQGSSHNGSSSASVSSGSAVTAYQYPSSFSSLHLQQQQQSYTFAQQSHRLYQQPAYSQSQMFSGRGAGPSNVAWVSPQEIGVAIGGYEDQEGEAGLPPEEHDGMVRYAHSQFPAVIRLDSVNYSYPHEDQSRGRLYAADQIGRSASAPPSQTYTQEGPARFEQQPYFVMYGPESDSPISSPTQGRFNLRLNLNTNAEFVQGVQTLRDQIAAAAVTDVFAGAYDYPRAKQLSPIAEVDYVSPDSLKKTKSLPFMSNPPSDVSATPYSRQNTNNTINTNNPSPGGSVSQGSEVTRPSPVYSSPFISRPLNRTVSQTSSRTHASTTSSVVPRITNTASKPTEPAPSLPPLDLRPPFPGPHPAHVGSGPPLRPSKLQRQHQQEAIGGLSTIVGSEEGGSYPDDSKYATDDVASLHADSFVTASSDERRGSGTGGATQKSGEKEDNEGGEEDENDQFHSAARHDPPTVSGESRADLVSVNSGRSHVQSASESFIARRWESDAGYGSGGRVTVLRTKRQGWLDTTPAFWAFWLGFVCPFLWLIGGWHFTHFGEQPPRLTFWEFYFNTRYWKETLGFCCRRRKRTKNMMMLEQEAVQEMTRISSQKKGKRDPPPVTRWVAEKQPNEQRRERLNDPKRSMRGISFGYPFIPRPMRYRPRREDWLARALRRLLRIVTAPNRLFDHLYGVKLFEVRGRAESSRRMFDPWIQRSRYAFCYALIVVSIGLCTASAYLIVYNTRQLR